MLPMSLPPGKRAVRIAIMKKKPQELFRLAREALLRAGAHETMAETAAQHLVRAEEQGLPTHGMSRVPFYCSMLRSGRADGKARPSMAADKAAVCLIDNADGLPYESAAWAIEEVIQRARRNGIGFAGISPAWSASPSPIRRRRSRPGAAGRRCSAPIPSLSPSRARARSPSWWTLRSPR
jgi:hypothetical protein